MTAPEKHKPSTHSRYEIKYLVETRRMDEIKNVLGGLLTPDANNIDERGYYNYSVYFDSPGYHAYLEKHEGQSDRVKPRIRLYRAAIEDPPVAVFLELKKRHNRTVSKERSRISLQLAEELLTRGPGPVEVPADDGRTVSEFMYVARRFAMVPAVTVLYHRSAYHSPIYPQVRLTFDRGIRCSLRTDLNIPSTSFSYALDPRYMIVELKFNDRAPDMVLQRCRSLNLSQVTFSKFAISLEHCLDGSRATRSAGAASA